MRYIGSKLKLIDYIKETISKYCGNDISDKVFCDMFSGTGIVARTMAPYVKQVIANDLEYYSYITNRVYLNGFDEDIVRNVVETLNNLEGNPNGKIAQEYAEGGSGNRLFYSKENGAKISAARDYIDMLPLGENEKNALILSIIDASDSVSNCTGVYGAFLKSLKPGAKNKIVFKVPTINKSAINYNHIIKKEDANKLIKEISGDILYLDPPYNTRQYSSNYHILNYIAENNIKPTESIAGLREHNKSNYSSKTLAEIEFDHLIEDANFEWIFLSYNNEGIIPIENIERIMKKYGEYSIEKRYHQRYKSDSKRRNLAGTDETIEYIHVLHKTNRGKKNIFSSKVSLFKLHSENQQNINGRVYSEEAIKSAVEKFQESIEEKETKTLDSVIISPMNYMGNKRKLLPQILPHFPKNINKFVDLFCGGCTVGINANAKEIIFNDTISPLIYLYQNFLTKSSEEIVEFITELTSLYNIDNKNREAYDNLKKRYNEEEFQNIFILFVLVAFGFNNQIRFNSKGEFNIPFGVQRSGWNPRMKNNLVGFVNALQNKKISFSTLDFREFNYEQLSENDFVYVDPPYLISQATYNSGWKEEEEYALLDILSKLNEHGIKFALSNVLTNKGKENCILAKWIEENHFNVAHLSATYSNSAYCRKEKDTFTDEILVKNY